MRKRLVWLASVTALTAVVLVGPPALAKRSQAVEIGSFTGAYLAARVAETDNDLDSAITYYQRTLDFDPDNQQLQQSLMLALISVGPLRRGAALCGEAEGGAGRRALFARGAGRRCHPQEGLHGGRHAAEAVAGIGSRQADLAAF